MDVLSDIFRMLRLRGTVYFHAAFRAPWGMEIPHGQFANFHIVTEGVCWLRSHKRDDLTRLNKGDMVIFPRGDCHALLHEPGAQATPAESLINDREENHESDHVIFGGKGQITTSLICGHFEYDRGYAHPLFETLDSLIYIPASTEGNHQWLETTSQLAANLSEANHPMSGAIIDRLAEALLIQALTTHIASLDNSQTFLAAVLDAGIGRALALMHADISKNLTLVELSRSVGMSRSVFAEKFREMVGETPIVYLAHLRLLKSKELVIETTMTLREIADRVGYQSEFSFSKAFKRLFGASPSQLRKMAGAF